MKKIFSLGLAVLMAVTALCGCGALTVNYMDKVTGTWSTKLEQSDEEIKELLEGNELYEEELALVDTPLYLIRTITFNTEKTYSFAYPVEECKAQVKEFYAGVFDDLYEGRESLKECYDTDISTLSQEDFRQFYAELYGAADYEELLQALADSAYDYTSFGIYEYGTFEISSTTISMDTEGTEDDGNVTYKADDGYLTLTFSDTTEVYNKIS